MLPTKWFGGAAALLVAGTALGHAHLTASVPAGGSVGKAPQRVVLTFSEAARITAMTLQRDGEEAHKVTPLPTVASANITIPVPRLAPGRYTLSWRVLGDDGHVVSGTLHFTVAESPAGTDAAAYGH